MADDREEQYVLRIQDRDLAHRLLNVLREDAAAKQEDANIELKFDSEEHPGTFTVGSDTFPVHLQNLPTIVESYKTYDDIHLVKSNDIGQMLIVTEKGAAAPEGVEARHGVTPPMRDARARHFRPHPAVDPNLVAKTEQDLLAILAGGAPDGVEYVDVEEEYVIDADGNGSWQPAKPLVKQQTQGPKPKAERKRAPPGSRSKKAKAAKEAAAAAAAVATPAAAMQPAVPSSAAEPATPVPQTEQAVEEI